MQAPNRTSRIAGADDNPEQRADEAAGRALLETIAADRARALTLTNVSRETLARLDRFVALLLDWRLRLNLVGPSAMAEIWTRHIADSLQLVDLAPDARIWVDLGSGAGFPGLIIAMALADMTEGQVLVHLVESTGKKCKFLEAAAEACGAPVEVHNIRAEKFAAEYRGHLDVVTARALAPMEVLLGWSYPLIQAGALGLFPKGQDVDAELTEATKCWNIAATLVASKTSAAGQIVRISSVTPRAHMRPSRARRTR